MNEKTTLATLDRISEGGSRLVVYALDRLRATKEALESGDFVGAEARANELVAKLATLSQAQARIAIFADEYALVRAATLREGMVVQGHGTVSEVTVDGELVVANIENGDKLVTAPEREVLIVLERDG